MTKEFVETIKVLDGQLINLPLHAARLERTARHYFGTSPEIKITVPPQMRHGVVKCRVVYDSKIVKVEFEPYAIRRPSSIVVVECSDICYAFKSTDRTQFEHLRGQNSNFDDVLITRDGLITDTTYANVVFEDRKGQLFTPDTPLLEGTKRQQLIAAGRIQPRSITANDLDQYTNLYLINAMIDIEDQAVIKIRERLTL